jgi:hypothetical protein
MIYHYVFWLGMDFTIIFQNNIFEDRVHIWSILWTIGSSQTFEFTELLDGLPGRLFRSFCLGLNFLRHQLPIHLYIYHSLGSLFSQPSGSWNQCDSYLSSPYPLALPSTLICNPSLSKHINHLLSDTCGWVSGMSLSHFFLINLSYPGWHQHQTFGEPY